MCQAVENGKLGRIYMIDKIEIKSQLVTTQTSQVCESCQYFFLSKFNRHSGEQDRQSAHHITFYDVS